jgi:hypothetical protein
LSFLGPRPPAEYAQGMRMSDGLAQATALAAVVGATTILGFAWPPGMYVSASSMLMAIVVGFVNSWVLLVEILR